MRVRQRILYYVTDTEAVPSILQNGLMKGLSNPDTAKGHLSAIYLTNDWRRLINDPDFQGDKSLLQVDATELPLIRDDNYPQSDDDEWAWYTEYSIEPDRLQLLGKISGNKLIKAK